MLLLVANLELAVSILGIEASIVVILGRHVDLLALRQHASLSDGRVGDIVKHALATRSQGSSFISGVAFTLDSNLLVDIWLLSVLG